MDDDTEAACWAQQALLEAQQRQEWDTLLQRDPAYAKWLERVYLIYQQEQEHEREFA